MARETNSAEAQAVSAGVVLEVLTGVPAEVFEALRPAAQAAVVARIVPDRLRTLDVASAEAVIAVAQRAVNALGAIQELALAACVRREELDLTELDGDWSDGSEHRPSAVKMVASSVAPLLRSTPRGAEARVGAALCLVDELPRTLALALDGQLDCRQTGVVVDHAQLVDMGARPLFDAAVTSVPEMPTLTPGRLRGVCERVAVAVDPDAVERRAQLGLRDRFVRVEPGVDPGMAWWKASIPSFASMQAWAAIDELAHEYVRADPSRSIDQARADAFVDLLLGSAQVSTTVELVVPTFVDSPQDAAAAAAAAAAPAPARAAAPAPAPARAAAPAPAPAAAPARSPGAEGAGIAAAAKRDGTVEPHGLEHVDGPMLAPVHAIASELFGPGSMTLGGLFGQSALEGNNLRQGRWRPPQLGVRDARAGWILSTALVEVLTDPDVVLRLTRADALTGVTVARDPLLYRPNAALAQRVRDRDRTCRFPGCGVAARRCDLDHVVPYPDGPTAEDNLAALCRTHHGFKHHSGWVLTMDAAGACTWTSPTGRSYVTHPADVRSAAA